MHGDVCDPALSLNEAVARDGSEAVYGLTAVGRSPATPPGRVRLPGLDPERDYRIRLLTVGATPADTSRRLPDWAALADGVVLPGRVLSVSGVQAPALQPERSAVLRLSAV